MHNLLSPGAINAPLLERVSAHIAAHPDSIYMGFWANGPITYDKTSESRFNEGACACIGSWAVALHEGHVNPDNFGIAAKACEVLWLDQTQGNNLFYSTNWPLPFYTRLERARTRDEYAAVVRERIAAFIQSGGHDGRARADREWSFAPPLSDSERVDWIDRLAGAYPAWSEATCDYPNGLIA